MEYAGTAYIGVVGPEIDYGVSWKSIVALQRRPGDDGPYFFSGTKGYELRQLHINRMLESEHAWLLLLDHDMVFEPDTLERLRGHSVSYVSGLYMRRQVDPMGPIWYRNNDGGEWPHEPFLDLPERGKLHKIGASGWGCILVHRQVFEDTRRILKGEPEVIEDDMDVWPFDHDIVFGALSKMGEALSGDDGYGDVIEAYETLARELRPLTAQKRTIQGSDIRFPYYAKAAGHQLWGDPDVRPGHLINYPLRIDDYERAGEEYHRALAENNGKRVKEARNEWRQRMAQL
jgi:hypothetical protein